MRLLTTVVMAVLLLLGPHCFGGHPVPRSEHHARGVDEGGGSKMPARRYSVYELRSVCSRDRCCARLRRVEANRPIHIVGPLHLQWGEDLAIIIGASPGSGSAELQCVHRAAFGRRAVKEVKFTSEIAATRATQASHGRYRLSPREAYVLRSAPIRGRDRTMWMVGDEDLSDVVEGLLLRGFLARRCGVGPAYADLTVEGRAAIDSSVETLRDTRAYSLERTLKVQ